MGHTAANRGSVSVPVGRKFALTSPVACSVSISTAPDAVLGSVLFAQLSAGIVYVFYIPAGSPPVFLSGLTTDPNGDSVPTQLTFIDSGASGI
jgi:hypothetical protein